MHGYRAVHVIVFPEDLPVEIQVRTLWQHEWAELFEKLADRVGREIRYGEPPRHEFEGKGAVEPNLAALSRVLRTFAVERALEVAELIDAAESGEATELDDSRLDTYRQRVDAELVNLRKTLEDV